MNIDEVYVIVALDGFWVFANLADADAFAAARGGECVVTTTPIIDSAEAKALIDEERS